MENASKALLIAGSILIVILLIAVGVRIFNSTQGTADNTETTMKATEVATFNNKILPYIGENKSKAQVQSLLNLIISNNATSDHVITVLLGLGTSGGTYKGDLASLRDLLNTVSNNTKLTYTVKIVGGDTDFERSGGHISMIQIY